MRKLVFLILAAAALLAGCNPAEMFDRFMPKEEVRLAEEFVAKVVTHDYDALEAAMKPELRTPALKGQLDEMARLLPAEALQSVRVVGYQVFKRSSESSYAITLEYEFANQWLLAGVRMQRSEARLVLEGITFTPRRQSLEAENRFTLEGKGPLHYAVLAFAIAIPLLVIYTLVLCIRTKFPKRKWLWILFILVGLVQFHFNWSSGAWDVQPIAFVLLGAGCTKSGPFAPWIFTLGFPLGAVLFLRRRRSLRKSTDRPRSDSPTGSTGPAERDVTSPVTATVLTPDEYR